jgi:hypothetical protein
VQFQLWTSECCIKVLYERNSKMELLHCHVGTFVVDNSNIPTKIKSSMTQIDYNTEGGLLLDSVVIYPNEFIEVKAFSICS